MSLCALGLALVVGAPLGWHLTHEPAPSLRPGTAVALATSGARSTPPPAPTGIAGSSRPAGASGPAASPSAVPTVPSSPPAAPSAPVRLRIDALHINAPVVAEGVAADGQMAIPEDIHTLGWYKFGPAPGAASGSIVIVGHVDSATAGLGTFFYLRNIPDHATITVTTSDGAEHTYQVQARESFAKDDEPLQQLFARTGAPRLTLITCGGTFDRATRSYKDNIVVTAVPTSGR